MDSSFVRASLDHLVGERDALGFARREHADQHGGDVRSGVGRLEAIAVLALLESLVLFKRGAASARRSCSPLVSGLGLFGSGAGLAKIGQCFLMVLGALHPRFVPFSRAVTGVPRAGRDD